MCLGEASRVTLGPSSILRRLSVVVRLASSPIPVNVFFSQKTGQFLTKLGKNVPWRVLLVLVKEKLTEFDFIKNFGCHGKQLEFS